MFRKASHTLRFIANVRKISLKHNLSEDSVGKALRNSLEDYIDIQFEPLRVQNYIVGTSFSRSGVTIQSCSEVNKNQEDLETSVGKSVNNHNVSSQELDFRKLFFNGFEALEQNVEGVITQNSNVNFALQAFRTEFLHNKDVHEECLKKALTEEDIDGNEELYVTALLANHLFGRMTANFGEPYFISNEYSPSKMFSKCPCEMCGEKIIYKNLGIGSELLWYGCPDIIVYSQQGCCNIVKAREFDRDEKNAYGDFLSDTNINGHDKKAVALLRSQHNVSEFVSQCITFSFYHKHLQMKRGLGSMPASFVPTIALTQNGTHFDVYLYDCDHDILLRNKEGPVPLWNHEWPETYLNMSSVLQIWMLLNHLYLEPRLSSDALAEMKGSFNLQRQFKSKHIDRILKTVSVRGKFYPKVMTGKWMAEYDNFHS